MTRSLARYTLSNYKHRPLYIERAHFCGLVCIYIGSQPKCLTFVDVTYKMERACPIVLSYLGIYGRVQSAYRLPSKASCSRVKVRSTPWLVPYPSADQAAAASVVAIAGHQQYFSSTKNRGKE